MRRTTTLLLCGLGLCGGAAVPPGATPPEEHLAHIREHAPVDERFSVPLEADGTPETYSLDDPSADHRAHAIALDEAGRPTAALASFRAAARFAEGRGGVELSGAAFNLAQSLADQRGTRVEQRAALRQAIAADPLNADAVEALADIGETEPPGLTALTIERVPWEAFAEGGKEVYRSGRVPFVLVMGSTGSNASSTGGGAGGSSSGGGDGDSSEAAWAAHGNWSLATLAAAYADEIVDHYPQSMGNVANRPYLRPWREAAKLFVEGASDPDASPQYIQWRIREGPWQQLRADVTPLPPFWLEHHWATQCLPPRTPALWATDNLFAFTRWRVAVVGNAGSGMFLHADAFASATWQAQIVGRKKWVLCHPDAQRLSTSVDLFAQEPPKAVTDTTSGHHDRCGVVTLHPGEMLLYPAGWWHQTLSLDTPTISLAHRVVDVRHWSSMATYLRNDCRNPGVDVEADFPGAAPLLKPEVCASIDACEALWKAHFSESDDFIGGLGTEDANEFAGEERRVEDADVTGAGDQHHEEL